MRTVVSGGSRCAEFVVVEGDDRHLVRHPQTPCPDAGQHADRAEQTGHEQPRRAGQGVESKHRFDSVLAAGQGRRTAHDPAWLHSQAGGLHGGSEAVLSSSSRVGFGGQAHIADAAMS